MAEDRRMPSDGGPEAPLEPGMPHRLDGVRIVYFEPLREIGGPMTDMLRSADAAQVTHVWQIDELRTAVRREDPDALLLEADTDEDAVLDFVRLLRRQGLETDPAIVIFTLRSRLTADQLQIHAAAGVDTVLEKPLSENMVGEHLVAAAAQPRFFVASRAYVGPERRAAPRADAPGPVFELPNRLRGALAGARADPAARRAALGPLLWQLAKLREE